MAVINIAMALSNTSKHELVTYLLEEIGKYAMNIQTCLSEIETGSILLSFVHAQQGPLERSEVSLY